MSKIVISHNIPIPSFFTQQLNDKISVHNPLSQDKFIELDVFRINQRLI